jgi:hypothetical protein
MGVVAAALLGEFAVAQTNVGQIAGRVTDSTGSVVSVVPLSTTTARRQILSYQYFKSRA